MMIKLKCLFLKLLKPLFIISLISCFTLLGNYSVKADYVNFGSPFEYYGDNYCNINSNYGIACSKSSILLTNYDAGYFKSVSSLFRTSEGIGFYYKSNPNNLNPFTVQGVINSGFVLCSGDTSSIVSGSSLLYADNDFCEAGYSKLVLTYSELLDFFKNHSPRLVGTQYPGYDVGIYFVFDGYYFTETLYGGGDAYPLNGQYIVKDIGISGQDYDTLTYGNNVLQSPFGSNGGNGTFENVNINNYNSMYQAYLRKGYNDVLCYGGYGLDNLYSTGDNLSGLIVGSGATVFDLYHEYGSGLHFSDWYNQNDNNFVYFDSFRDGYEASNFLGKSKGLLGLGLVKKIYWKSNNPLLSNDLQIFCNIVINHSDEIDHNTWEGSIFDDYLDQNKLNQLIGDVGVVVPTVGTPLDVLRGQYMSGSSSFTGCDSPEDCITNGGIDRSIDMAWKTWSIEGLRGNITGILPWYIVFGFLGIMFLYILRR